MARGFRAIVPKKDPFVALANLARVRQAMSNMLRDGQRQLSTYPSSQTSYRRTGTLGRGWTVAGPSPRGKDLVGRIGNKTKYGRPVQGKRQTKVFARYNWPQTTEVGKEIIKTHKPRLQAALKGTGV